MVHSPYEPMNVLHLQVCIKYQKKIFFSVKISVCNTKFSAIRFKTNVANICFHCILNWFIEIFACIYNENLCL